MLTDLARHLDRRTAGQGRMGRRAPSASVLLRALRWSAAALAIASACSTQEPPAPCQAAGVFPASARVKALGIEAFEATSTGTSSVEVRLRGSREVMGTIRLDSATLGVMTAQRASIELGGERVTLESYPYFRAEGNLEPFAIDAHYVLGDRRLEVQFEWRGEELATMLWATRGPPEGRGAGTTRDGGWNVLRTLDGSQIDAWLDANRLRSSYDGIARRALDASLDDPALWAAAAWTGEACVAERGLRAAQGAPAWKANCEQAAVACASAEDFCEAASHRRGRRCAGRRSVCQAAVEQCRSSFERSLAALDVCARACGPCSEPDEVSVLAISNGSRAQLNPICTCRKPTICCAESAPLPPGYEGPRPRPCECSGTGGCAGNDPRFVTFDGDLYDYQGAGEFILAETEDRTLVVQARMAVEVTCGGFTTQKAVAVKVGDVVVRFEADEGRFVRVDGGPPLAIDAFFGASGVWVERRPGLARIEGPEGDEITVEPHQNYRWLNVVVRPAPGRAGRLRGLMVGPAASSSRNDLDLAFGPGVRVRQADSLFEYGPGESTETFTRVDFPPRRISLAGVDPAARGRAERLCEGVEDPRVREGCIQDVACSGDDDAAAWYDGLRRAPALVIDESIERVVDDTGETFVVSNGPAGRPEDVGCSDGQREGFIDAVRFADIAGCLGAWTSTSSMRTPGGMSCGDDLGDCGVPADLCAAGWRVCGASGDASALAALSASDCEGAGSLRYFAAISHCSTQTIGTCDYDRDGTPTYDCFDAGWCSEAVCCGAGCPSVGACADALWPGRTHIWGGQAASCGTMSPRRAGVLCCR